MKERTERELLEYGILRQMDIQNAEYPVMLEERDKLLGPLEFAQMVHSNIPVKFNQTATGDWCKAMSVWNKKGYLEEKLAGSDLLIAETPYGNADAPLDGRYFVQPYIRTMKGNEFFNGTNSSEDGGENERHIVRYMQSQDDNFPREFEPISNDAPHSIEFADRALGQQPAAVNLWLGQDVETVSRLHNDNYENIYVQVSGQKEIYLIPPGDAYALDERFLESAEYNEIMELVIQPPLKEKKNRNVLFPTVDPSDVTTHNDVYRRHAQVYRVVLDPGDMLYLPALWYHQIGVASVGAETGLNVSLNYWYTASSTSGLWMRWDYVRLTALVLRGYHDDEYFEEEGEE